MLHYGNVLQLSDTAWLWIFSNLLLRTCHGKILVTFLRNQIGLESFCCCGYLQYIYQKCFHPNPSEGGRWVGQFPPATIPFYHPFCDAPDCLLSHLVTLMIPTVSSCFSTTGRNTVLSPFPDTVRSHQYLFHGKEKELDKACLTALAAGFLGSLSMSYFV